MQQVARAQLEIWRPSCKIWNRRQRALTSVGACASSTPTFEQPSSGGVVNCLCLCLFRLGLPQTPKYVESAPAFMPAPARGPQTTAPDRRPTYRKMTGRRLTGARDASVGGLLGLQEPLVTCH